MATVLFPKTTRTIGLPLLQFKENSTMSNYATCTSHLKPMQPASPLNQPRLLSKNGVSAGEPDSSDSAAVPASSSSASSTVRKRVNTPVAKKISKFLWDDPGDSNGIATIRIDVLPGATLTETISWRQANIVDTTATLIDDKRGLLIEVESEEGTRFRLQIPKLYGQVDEVRKVVKPNRLIVRLYKTRGWTNKKNLQAWPNP